MGITESQMPLDVGGERLQVVIDVRGELPARCHLCGLENSLPWFVFRLGVDGRPHDLRPHILNPNTELDIEAVTAALSRITPRRWQAELSLAFEDRQTSLDMRLRYLAETAADTEEKLRLVEVAQAALRCRDPELASVLVHMAPTWSGTAKSLTDTALAVLGREA